MGTPTILQHIQRAEYTVGIFTKRIYAMMNAIQVWPQLMQIAGDLVVKAQDWPGAEELAERLQKTVPPQFLSPEQQQENGGPPPIPPEVVQHMQQLLQQLQQENQALKADKTIDFKKLEIQSYDAETKRIQALNQDRGMADNMEYQAIAKLLDASKALDEHDIQRRQMQHKEVMDHANLGTQHAQMAIDHTQFQQTTEQAAQALSQKASQQATPASSNGAQ